MLEVRGKKAVAAHQQAVTHSYVLTFPGHEPRSRDPHKHDFEAWKKRRKDAGTWYCDFAHEHRAGDAGECDMSHPLEAHHKVIELAVLNEVDFLLLEKDYPGISAQDVGAWIDGDDNLTLLCRVHHRSAAGVHTASASDYASAFYVRGLIRPRDRE